MLLPALTRARLKAHSVHCMNNSKQMMLAWRMYCEDHSDKIPSAYGNPAVWIPPGDMTWTGNARTDGGNQFNWNVDVMVKKSLLWPYCGKNAGIWRCPGDNQYPCTPTSGPNAGQSFPRQRSISMLSWLNGSDAQSFGSGFTVYTKLTGILNPGPSMTIVFLDERCDSINDGEWCSNMSGWPDKPQQWYLTDFPASYHGGAGGIAFVDGHSEIHKWRDARTTPPIGKLINLNIPSPKNPDAYWIMEHSTRNPRQQ
jgi:prepilin-type processing-associated H-X9-DG protein